MKRFGNLVELCNWWPVGSINRSQNVWNQVGKQCYEKARDQLWGKVNETVHWQVRWQVCWQVAAQVDGHVEIGVRFPVKENLKG